MKKIALYIIVLIVALVAGILYGITRKADVAVGEDGTTMLSPTQLQSIENIGEWEFLTVNDQELIDTVRHGFFGDDQLMRIYYGTLRLGINTKDLKEGWCKVDGDSITCTLPAIQLLDEHFIDEAKTTAFYESGKWTGADKQAMYQRAHNRMLSRALRASNIRQAENQAETHFYRMLKAMGFQNVRIRFAQKQTN